MDCSRYVTTRCLDVAEALNLFKTKLQMTESASNLEVGLRNWLVLVQLIIAHVRRGLMGTGLTYYAGPTNMVMTDVVSGLSTSQAIVRQIQVDIGAAVAINTIAFRQGREVLQHWNTRVEAAARSRENSAKDIADEAAVKAALILSSLGGVRGEVWNRMYASVLVEAKEAHKAGWALNTTSAIANLRRNDLWTAAFSLGIEVVANDAADLGELMSKELGDVQSATQQLQQVVSKVSNLYTQIMQVLEQSVTIVTAALDAAQAFNSKAAAEDMLSIVGKFLSKSVGFSSSLTRISYARQRMGVQQLAFEGMTANISAYLSPSNRLATGNFNAYLEATEEGGLIAELNTFALSPTEESLHTVSAAVQIAGSLLDQAETVSAAARRRAESAYTAAGKLEKTFAQAMETVFQRPNVMMRLGLVTRSAYAADLDGLRRKWMANANKTRTRAADTLMFMDVLEVLGISFEADEREIERAKRAKRAAPGVREGVEGIVLPQLVVDMSGIQPKDAEKAIQTAYDAAEKYRADAEEQLARAKTLVGDQREFAEAAAQHSLDLAQQYENDAKTAAMGAYHVAKEYCCTNSSATVAKLQRVGPSLKSAVKALTSADDALGDLRELMQHLEGGIANYRSKHGDMELRELVTRLKVDTTVLRLGRVASTLEHTASRAKERYHECRVVLEVMQQVWSSAFTKLDHLVDKGKGTAGDAVADVENSIIGTVAAALGKAQEVIEWSKELGTNVLSAMDMPSKLIQTFAARFGLEGSAGVTATVTKGDSRGASSGTSTDASVGADSGASAATTESVLGTLVKQLARVGDLTRRTALQEALQEGTATATATTSSGGSFGPPAPAAGSPAKEITKMLSEVNEELIELDTQLDVTIKDLNLIQEISRDSINDVDDFLDDCAVWLVELLGHGMPFLLSIVPLAANNLVLLRAFLVCASLCVLTIALYESQWCSCLRVKPPFMRSNHFYAVVFIWLIIQSFLAVALCFAVILASGLLVGIAKGCDSVPLPHDEALLTTFCDTLAASAERRYKQDQAMYGAGVADDHHTTHLRVLPECRRRELVLSEPRVCSCFCIQALLEKKHVQGQAYKR
jgi:hypothetical protein